ncbi:MAG: STAS domain-containing protein [Gammaproteobacteria bacterium]|nr:STAS domain-containing protein [Gammaproteobacteria bacterium]
MEPIILMKDDSLMVSGPLTLKTVSKLFDQPLVFNSAAQVIDLKEVTHIDSAGLALLIHWSHEAQRAQSRAVYCNLPENLKELAQLCMLDEMFR